MKYIFIILSVFVYCTDLFSQIVLIGDNIPHGVINDGDFSSSSAEWRKGMQSPAWKMKNISPDVYEKDSKTMGLHRQMMFSSNAETIAESVALVSDKYPKPLSGDTLIWSFCADQEYKGNGNISMSIVFGDREHVLISMVSPKGADMKMEEYKGFYIIDKKDAESGSPFLRIRFCSDKGIKLFVDNIYVAVVRHELNGPLLKGIGRNGYNSLTWSDKAARHGTKFYVYRKNNPKGEYVKISETESTFYNDSDIVSGKKYDYVVTRFHNSESGPSEVVNCGASDRIAPLPPTGLSFESGDTEIKLSWKKSTSHDVAFYSVYRVDSKIKTPVLVSKECSKTFFTDIMLPKGTECKYLIYAHDYSGNRSNPAVIEGVKTKMVEGTSFSDLILPLPVTGLDSLLWGGSNVLPRCADNGIESPAWSYWGGRPVYANGKYNMVVTRWPEISVKGHWEWPFSTVAYTVSEKPEGPYKVVCETAYDFKNGLGHNPDIILLNDGTYALYSLVSWNPTIFTSSSMAGPWKRLGVLQIDSTSNIIDWPRFYQYQRNLSGVQLKDGRILMVTKFGAMMISENGLLGPYKILTKSIHYNPTIPPKYRNVNFEDPVMWKDDVQFHLIINAFIKKEAVYFRSSDGINWVYEPGIAYSPYSTVYEDGTMNIWDKLERPHVIQDEYGRATHLSLAAIDCPKEEDYGNDNHNSKNIIIPLTVHKRVKVKESYGLYEDKGKVIIEILSEKDFSATNDVDVASLRLGSANIVNYGSGCKVKSHYSNGDNLIVEFEVKKGMFNSGDNIFKLLGKTYSGKLIISYMRNKKT